MEITIQNAPELIQMINERGDVITFYAWQAITLLAISVAFWLTVYVLMGVGLFVMGKKRNFARPWLGFVPFVRYYFMGKLAGETRFFGKKVKNIGLFVAIVSAVTTILNLLYNVKEFYPLISVFLSGTPIVFTANEAGQLITTSFNYEYAPFITILADIAYYVNYFADILLIFLKIMLYIELFKKYSPEHHFLFAILCIFLPIDGIMVFIMRKKVAVNFNDYLKERFMRMQGTFSGHRPTPPDNPFREFGGRGENDPGDPFADFSSEKKTKTEDPFSEFDEESNKKD